MQRNPLVFELFSNYTLRSEMPNPLNPLQALIECVLPDGGFAEHPGSTFRPDATAWAVMALEAAGDQAGLAGPARSRLATVQAPDGRVPLSPDHPESAWPTPLSMLAWRGSPAHREQMALAAEFLLQNAGWTGKRRPDAVFAHDPEIPGWPWSQGAFSWVEPTAMSIMALEAAGYGSHARVRDGVRLLMDRQLPGGGWNYGNTIVYGLELLPQPDQTGIALAALVSRVGEKDVQASLAYLLSRVPSLRAPRSLCWAILGLGAWNQRPAEAQAWILECMNMQDRYGPYGASLLALLALAEDGSGLEALMPGGVDCSQDRAVPALSDTPPS